MADEQKLEDTWITNHWPGADKYLTYYDGLSPRELPIVLVAANDVMLTDALKNRLPRSSRIVDDSFGANRGFIDSSAKLIKMAFFTGLIDEGGYNVLKSIADIRNHFAHEVNADYDDPKVQGRLQVMADGFTTFLTVTTEHEPEDVKGIERLAQQIRTLANPQAKESRGDENKDTRTSFAQFFLVWVNGAVQAHFARTHKTTSRMRSVTEEYNAMKGLLDQVQTNASAVESLLNVIQDRNS